MVQSIYYIISVTVTPMALRPLVAIFGTTGVGKSKLAIELALALSITKKHGWQGARIINADSMQVYAGMDIITNKVPQSERQGVEHLLMGFKQPGEQYIVGEWVNDALKAVSDYDIRILFNHIKSFCRLRRPTNETRFPLSLGVLPTGFNTSYSQTA
jgi:IPP transferase